MLPSFNHRLALGENANILIASAFGLGIGCRGCTGAPLPGPEPRFVPRHGAWTVRAVRPQTATGPSGVTRCLRKEIIASRSVERFFLTKSYIIDFYGAENTQAAVRAASDMRGSAVDSARDDALTPGNR